MQGMELANPTEVRTISPERRHDTDSCDRRRLQPILVLKLFKADVCTAVNVQAPGAYGEGFDIHASGEGPMTELFHRTRGTCEVIGRLLGEMKATDMGGGESLLD